MTALKHYLEAFFEVSRLREQYHDALLNNEEGYIVIVRFKRMREAERRFWQARAELWKNIRNVFGW